MGAITFSVEKRLKGALGRAGVLTTPHGVVRTPAFVPVGTLATVKSITPEEIKALGAQIVLANTYHLYLQPGEAIMAKAGGVGKFMHYDGPTMTDSGGFQVFSLGFARGHGIAKVLGKDKQRPQKDEAVSEHGKLVRVDEDGVTFMSHIDGSAHRFTPERSIEMQENIGADIIFAFDECTSPLLSREKMEASLARTHRWAQRSFDAHTRKDQALFGIVQGGRYPDLRKQSAEYIASIDFDGFGIGGSFDKDDMTTIVALVNSILPEGKPRHMLGIGEIEDLFEGVEHGIDLFDCALPTRIARNGTLLTAYGKKDILKAEYKELFEPIEKQCGCYTCANYTKAYLHHLFKSSELLGYRLATIHNLYFIVHLVDAMRAAIINDTFFDFKKEFLAKYKNA